MAQIIVVLALIGLCVGSFVNALVWRLHEQAKKPGKTAKKLSILNGRSMCVYCRHELAWYDLIPLVSWLNLKGRCRYCHKSISWQYPAVELTAGLVYVLSYIFWPVDIGTGGQWLLFSAWLVSAIGLLALAVYDIRWMLLPNRIIYPTLAAAAAGRLGYIIFYDNRPARAIFMWAASLLIASGIFFVLFTLSKGKWIGFGDVRLGLITGTLLALPQNSLLMIFIASLLGSLVAIPDLARGRKELSSRLPYGPFLIMAAWIVVLFGKSILDHYARLMGIQ